MGSTLLLAKPKPKIDFKEEDLDFGYFRPHHEPSIQIQLNNYFKSQPKHYLSCRFIASRNGYMVGAEAKIIDEFGRELYKATAEADDPFMAEMQTLTELVSTMAA
jgi:hypothetical protein